MAVLEAVAMARCVYNRLVGPGSVWDKQTSTLADLTLWMTALMATTVRAALLGLLGTCPQG